jgi:hypothetical protein
MRAAGSPPPIGLTPRACELSQAARNFAWLLQGKGTHVGQGEDKH